MKTSLLQWTLSALTFAACTHLHADNNYTWIGGDKSTSVGVEDTILKPENWSLGAVPYYPPDCTITIQTEDDYAYLLSVNNRAILGALSLGDADTHPSVTLHVATRRHEGIDDPRVRNDDSDTITFRGLVNVTGTNTTLRIDAGMTLSLSGGNHWTTFDPGAKICGEGVLAFNDEAYVPAHDYDSLDLSFSRQGSTYTLLGDIQTAARGNICPGGSAGIGNISILDLDGFTATFGSDVRLGNTNINRELDGNQPSFGGIFLRGGTLKIGGNLIEQGDPDGTFLNGTPVTAQSYIATNERGGTIRLKGSFENVHTRDGSGWDVENVDLILCGDGSNVQKLEVMSANLGDDSMAAVGNFYWKSLTIESGARACLVDVCKNIRSVPGPECLYLGDLTVEEGATFDLNGYTVYVSGKITLDGTVINGPSRIIHAIQAHPVTQLAYPLGDVNIARTTGSGFWVSEMIAGDINGDGKTELCVMTCDEAYGTEDASQIWVFNYANGELTPLAPFPISDEIMGNSLTENFIVMPDGFGNKGPGILAMRQGYTPIMYLESNGTLSYPFGRSDEWVTFGPSPMVYADINRDGTKEVVATTPRWGNIMCRALNPLTGEIWRAEGQAEAGIIPVLSAADLDDDGYLEILTVAKGNGTNYGLYVFRHDGTPYVSPTGKTLTHIPHSIYAGEMFGGISAADVNGDGLKEILFYTKNADGLVIMNQEGEELLIPATRQNKNASGNWPNRFVLADFDKDHVYEIVFSGKIYRGDGTVMLDLPAPAPSTYVARSMVPSLADFNGDQIPEVVYVCTDDSDGNRNRYVTVYDVAHGKTLTGFPRLAMHIKNPASNYDWWQVADFHHWHGAFLLVADLDQDGTWEIVLGTGHNQRYDIQPYEYCTLNVIDTPFKYTLPPGRTAQDMGWYSRYHDDLQDSLYPLYKEYGTMIMLR